MSRRIPLLSTLLSFLQAMSSYASLLNAKEIARRMFVTNSFDGLLSTLGIILGNYASGTTSLNSYIGGVLGSSFALGFFSGMVATYLSERAERLNELRRTEKVMLHSLRGSIYEKAAKIVPVYVAVWSGLGALILPGIGVSPFIAAKLAGLSVGLTALVAASTAIVLGELFLLGAYLGRISGENVLVSGARMAAIGLAAAAALAVLGGLL